MSLVLADAAFLDWRTGTLEHGDFRVTEGAGGRIERAAGAPAPGDEVLRCGGRLVVRAFACGHHHVYSALARGMPGPPRPPRSFAEILELVWWRLDRALDLGMVEASALATAMACALNGVTLVVDHHSSPRAAAGSLEVIAAAFERVGIRHLLCLELSDRDGEAAREEGLAESERYLTSGRPGLVGLHASFTVGDGLLERAVELARRYRTGIHIHVAEDPVDQERTLERYGLRVVERLQRAGVLDLDGTILAHCLHLDARERELVAASPAWVVQNTESNQNNAVGVFDACGLGGRIMLGTDGMHSDMIRSARAAYLAGRSVEGMTPAGAAARLRAVHGYAAQRGLGRNNDLVVLDYDSPTPVNPGNWAAHLVYGLQSRHVLHVISEGRPIVRDRRLVTADGGEILAFAREQAVRLWHRLAAPDPSRPRGT